MSITITKGKLAFAAALLAAGGAAQAATATLVSHTLVSSGGTPSNLIFNGSNCVFGAPTSSAAAAGTTCQASNATWDWSNGVLTGSGLYQAWTHISGLAAAPVVLADEVSDLVINTNTSTTSASSYLCIEGTFLAGVGAHGCANVGTGDNFFYEGSVVYNVGGQAHCVNRTIGGDDVDFGDPRGVTDFAGGGGCDATAGAFVQWLVVDYTPGFYGVNQDRLILANQANYTAASGNFMTFNVLVPVPAAVWLFGSALGLMGFLRRRMAA